MSDGKGLTVEIEGDELVIRISAEVMATAVKHMPRAEIFDEDLDEFFAPKVTDAPEFLREVHRALHNENEAGETLVHKMLDKAAMLVMHSGGEGVLSAQEVRDFARAAKAEGRS